LTERSLAQLRKLAAELRYRSDARSPQTKRMNPSHTWTFHDRSEADKMLEAGIAFLADYQARLAAQDVYGLLLVLQGLDASGKDGVVKHVMSGVNPQGVSVHPFKEPSAEELNHDFLWRYAGRAPARGSIAIFNRSHYEEVLVVRVHPELLERERVPPEAQRRDIWNMRFEQINDWERHLVDDGIRVVKVFLNVSREEQRQRFLARIDDAEKNWKFSTADVRERAHWDAYQRAYRDMLRRTSTAWAPWHVVPADHKWFARVAVAALVVDALASINPQYPRLRRGARTELLRVREQLLAEGTNATARGRARRGV